MLVVFFAEAKVTQASSSMSCLHSDQESRHPNGVRTGAGNQPCLEYMAVGAVRANPAPAAIRVIGKFTEQFPA
jgi:hypothetical protein